MKAFIVAISFMLCCGSAVRVQGQSVTTNRTHSYTFKQFADESWQFMQAPGTWDDDDWLTLGIVGAGTILFMETTDLPVREAVMRDRTYVKSFPIEFGRVWGELYTPVVLFSGFAAYSLLADDPKARKIGYEIGQASIYAGLLTYMMKLIIGRSRPYVGEGNLSFHPFSTILNPNYQSLPGGHNAAAFVLSTVLSRNVESIWLKVLAYVPAVLTFISRVYQDKHWVSDDFMGAALGYFVATWVVDRHEIISSPEGLSSYMPLSIRITL